MFTGFMKHKNVGPVMTPPALPTEFNTFGSILTGDGTNFDPPEMAHSVVQTKQYVPQEIAIEKMKDVALKLEETRVRYHDHVAQQNEHYIQEIEKTKKYYEEHINGIKAKALEHIKQQKITSKAIEQRLQRELRERNEEIERQIDRFAENTRSFQDKIRDIKHDHQDTLNIRKECFSCLNSICSTLEERTMTEIGTSNQWSIHQTVNQLRQLHTDNITSINIQNNDRILMVQEDNDARLMRLYLNSENTNQSFQNALEQETLRQKFLEAKEHELLLIIKQHEEENFMSEEDTRAHIRRFLDQLNSLSLNLSEMEELRLMTTEDLKANYLRTIQDKDARGEEYLHAVEREQNELRLMMMEDLHIHNKNILDKCLLKHNQDIKIHEQKLSNLSSLSGVEVQALKDTVEMISEDLLATLQRQQDSHMVIITKLKEKQEIDMEQIRQKFKNQFAKLSTLKKEADKEIDRISSILLRSEVEYVVSNLCSQVEFRRMKISHQSTEAKLEDDLEDLQKIQRDNDIILNRNKENEMQRQKELEEMKLLVPKNAIIYAASYLLNELKNPVLTPVIKVNQRERESDGEEDNEEDGNGNDNGKKDRGEGKGDSDDTEIQDTTTTTLSTAASEPAESVVPPPPTPAQILALSSIRVALQQELVKADTVIDGIKTNLTAKDTAIREVSERERKLNNVKVASKGKIKDWLLSFEKENCRAPTNAEKEAQKPLYQAYKQATKTQENNTRQKERLEDEKKAIMQFIQQLVDNKKQFQDVIAEIDMTYGGRAEGTAGIASRKGDDGTSVTTSNANTRRSSTSTTPPSMTKAIDLSTIPDEFKGIIISLQDDIERLNDAKDDSEYALKTNIATLENEKNELSNKISELMTEKDEISNRFETLKNLKRTDLIKKYEEELETLRASSLQAKEFEISVKAERIKTERKIEELKERAEKAENDLIQKESLEKQQLIPGEENTVLKETITTQRDEILQKTKAVTIGWDAAAEADEKLEKSVEKAYDKGYKDGKKEAKEDLDSLHLAIEQKENHATESLEKIAVLNKQIVELEKKESELLAQLSQARAKALRGGGATLKNAQEEVLQLTQKVDDLRIALKLSEKKIALYKQLMAARESASLPASASSASLASTATAAALASSTSEQLIAETKLKTTLEEILRNMKTASSQVDYDNDVVDEVDYDNVVDEVDYDNDVDEVDYDNDVDEVDYDNDVVDEVDYDNDVDEVDHDNVVDEVDHDNDVDEVDYDDVVDEGSDLWTRNKKDDAGDVYTKATQDAIKKFSSSLSSSSSNSTGNINASALRDRLSEALSAGTAKGMSKSKAAPILRKAIDKFLNDAPAGSVAAAESANAQAVKAAATATQNGESSTTTAAVVDEAALLAQLKKLEGMKLRRPPTDVDGTESTAALLRRAQEAEMQIVILQKQVAEGGGGGGSGGGGGGGGGKKGGVSSAGADPAEIRKLQKRIKELEAGGGGGGGGNGGGGGGDKKAMAALEKKFQKQLKDAETTARKEKSAVETRASRAETELAETSSSLSEVTQERDQLKRRVQELSSTTAEMDALRAKATL
eukprot:gene6076-12261_t